MTRFRARAASIVALALGGAIVAGAVAWSLLPGRSARFVEYKAEAMDVPTAVAVAADDTVWFTMDLSAAIGRVRDGHIERLPTPGPGLQPIGLGAAADGGVWYTDNAAHAVAHMSRDGLVSRFGLETPSV